MTEQPRTAAEVLAQAVAYADEHVDGFPPETEVPDGFWGARILDALAEQGYALTADEAQARPAVASEGLPLDGVVAELMGVEAHLDEARERLIKANLTLAAIAAAYAAERQGES